jgi:xylose isomerase
MTTPTPEVYEFDAAAIQDAVEAAREAAAEQFSCLGGPTALDLTADKPPR